MALPIINVQITKRKNEFMKILKRNGRTLLWFQQKFIPNKSVNQCSKELNGHTNNGISQKLQVAMYKYETWQARLDKKMEEL